MSDVSLEKRLGDVAWVDKEDTMVRAEGVKESWRLWVSMVDLKRELRVSAEKIRSKKIEVDKLLNPLEIITTTKRKIARDFNTEIDEILKELVEPSSDSEDYSGEEGGERDCMEHPTSIRSIWKKRRKMNRNERIRKFQYCKKHKVHYHSYCFFCKEEKKDSVDKAQS